MTRATGSPAAWAELLRVSALASVPGDALAGAAAAGTRPGRGTLWAIGASLCLYEAGMALNDWADRDEDAAERPHRPLPSGRITPAAALAASAALTATGLGLASRAGRPALAVATALAATVWAYDLGLKHTPAGPATMATARALDLLLGATATTHPPAAPATTPTPTPKHQPTAPATAPVPAPKRPPVVPATTPARAPKRPPAVPLTALGPAPRRPTAGPAPSRHPRPLRALPAAALLGAHTYAVTAVSRHETHGGSTRTPLAALAVTLTVAAAASSRPNASLPAPPSAPSPSGPSDSSGGPAPRPRPALPPPGLGPLLTPLLALAYARTPATHLLHAALNPSAALTERAVGGGIRATIPLQAALAARAGAPATALGLLGLVPLARALARKVSPT
ncbi:SCO3242 family prenyltransferase [Streptomyces sp. NPDC056169]|uniref:SCO3242 family prenyltransferase n=1 Tax=Streptomyces sp. NPDC056169 TaxID=3345734 RepID=UPI0035DE1277